MAHRSYTVTGNENDLTALDTAFAYMNMLKSQGSSRAITFHFDGDGAASLVFHTVEGDRLQFTGVPLEPIPVNGWPTDPVAEIREGGDMVVSIGG